MTSDNLSGFGVVYCATSKFHSNLAGESAKSLKAVEPDLQTTVFVAEELLPEVDPIFSRVEVLGSPSYSYDDKISAIARSPYPHTLYVDADTHFLSGITDELQKLSSVCEVAVRGGMSFNLGWEFEFAPESIAQFNTGVIYFSSRGRDVITQLWRDLREAYPESHDQPTFRRALLDSRIFYSQISGDFNFMGVDFVTHKPRLAHFASVRSERLVRFARKNCEQLPSAKPGTLCVFWHPVNAKALLAWRLYLSLVLVSYLRMKQIVFDFAMSLRQRFRLQRPL